MSAFRKFDLNLIPASTPGEGAAKVAKAANPGRFLATLATLAGHARVDAEIHRARLAVVPDLADPKDIRVWLHERAAMREDSGTPRDAADKAAFDELLWIWHAANPVEHAPGQCAACGTAFEPPVMVLPDGATVCDRPDHPCLISYGTGRRTEAVGALKSLGVAQPMWWKL